MPLNYYSTFLEYSASSLLFAGQSRHTVSKQWASTRGRPTVAGLRPKGLAPRRRPSPPTACRSLGGPPPGGRRRSPRVAGLRVQGRAVASKSPHRSGRRHHQLVSARPLASEPPPSMARRRLGGSPPVRAEASPAGLRTAAGLRASALSGAPLPRRVPAGPGGDIICRSPPGRAGAMLARLRPPRARALEYLRTLGQNRLFG